MTDHTSSAITSRTKRLKRQIVVRVPDALHDALTTDAADNGRTVAQSVRFILTRSLLDENGREVQS